MELFLVMSDDKLCNNPMGIYNTLELAKSHADKLLYKSIHARVCKYIINQEVHAHGNLMMRVYENGFISDSERNEKIMMNSCLSHVRSPASLNIN